tara:strand:- start:240 stop:422 length:183 start_codon:yes stop_codon:yes gene_type:complete
MPTHEEVEQFFMNFAREMRNQGLFIMDDYKIDWPNLPTKDDIRNMENPDSDSDEDDYYYQ